MTQEFDDFHNRAMAAFSAGRHAEVESLCLQALAIQPDHVGVQNLLGQVFLALGRHSEASRWFESAIQLSPKRPNLRYNLALAKQAEGRTLEAIESVRVAIELDPSVAMLHAKLGQLLAITGAPLDAAKALRQALKLDPKSVSFRVNLAQALSDLGQMEEAENLTRAALFLNPKEATVHRMLGRIHQLNGRFEEAAGCFETAIALQPNQAAAYFALAYSKRITPADRETMGQMEALLETPLLAGPDRGQLHYALGKGLDDLGEFGSATEHFDLANQIALDALSATGHCFDADLEAMKVDRLIELFSAEVFVKWRSAGATSERPILIVGMIRSGTTLVEQIISRHPDVCPAGELRYWVENHPRMVYEMSANPERPPDLDSWRIEYEAELDRVSATSPRITDKMPLNYWAIGLIHLAYPDARIIHCNRDPRDTCLSIYVTPYRRSPEFGHDRDNIAAAYRQYRRLMSHWQGVIPPNRLLQVKYEDLVSNTEFEIRQLIEFCDLSWNDVCLVSTNDRRIVSTPSQWQVRQPVYQRSAGRWRNYGDWLGPILDLAVEPR